MRFQGANECPAKGQELNYIVDNALVEVIKANKLANYLDANDSSSKDDLENFKFEKLSIREKQDNSSGT